MSRHLYIAYSNLHLLFAQALALGQEQTDQKDLWLGTQVAGSPLEQLYQRMIIPGLWHQVIPLTLHRSLALPIGRVLFRHPCATIGRWRSALQQLNAASVAAQYDALWVAHPFDPLTRILAQEMHRQGKKVHFYEEGLSVYLLHGVQAKKTTWTGRLTSFVHKLIARSYRVEALLNPISTYLTDAWLVLPEAPSIFPAELSLVDIKSRFNRKYIEVALRTSSLGETVPQAAAHYPAEPFLLLLCSVEIEDKWFGESEYLAALQDQLRTFQGKVSVIAVKPHPRTDKRIFALLLEKIRQLDFRCVVVEEKFPVPIEFLLPSINCLGVVGGISSPLVYLRQLYAVSTHSVLPSIDRRGLSAQSLAYVQTLEKLFSAHPASQPPGSPAS